MKPTDSAPNPQSVCKHHDSKYGVCGLPQDDSIHHNDIYEYYHEFVAKPAESNPARTAGVIADALHNTDPTYEGTARGITSVEFSKEVAQGKPLSECVSGKPLFPSEPASLNAEPQCIAEDHKRGWAHVCKYPQPVAGEGPTRNSEVLASFVRYCQENPEHRFWQALRNWSGYPFITVSDFSGESRDTFYWKGKRHDGK